MATNKTTIVVEATDNGTTEKLNKSAKDTNKNYKELLKTFKELLKATESQNSYTPGSKAASAVPKSMQGAMTDQEYGKARGSAGSTGASARDFANQAQGLGGLVRLYATYAANVFAVGAAFRALSAAMDTSNMVKGLDQLGTSSGVALGSLSKQLVKSTDGAISLRDAMESVAKASSSGMSSKNILRMGEVAKKASQALGIDMADAMSRITRASTKLEPELVDELGLFTKTGKASEDYAKSIGKSVAQLTDFERRMAYSNALLAEGEKKFGEINLDTNPYTKLAATIKDVAQSGLELINKVLAPIAGYLSQSPTALALSLAAIGSVLLKQALPAIGQFKAGLAHAAEQAKELAIQKAADAANAMSKVNEQILQKLGDIADDKVAAVDAAEKKVLAMQQAGISKASKAYKLLQMDIREVTEEHIRGVEERAKVADTQGKSKEAEVYREVATAVREHKAAEDDFVKTKETRLAQTVKEMQQQGVLKATLDAAQKSQESAVKKQIISNAAYNGSLVGTRNAMVLLRSEIASSELQLTKFGTYSLLARGYIASLAGAVSTLASAFGNVLGIVGVFVAVFTLVDGAFSKNAKQATEYKASLEMVGSTVSTLQGTFDKIAKKDPLETLNAESLNAKATAIVGVADAVSELVTKLASVDKAASGWDRFIDGIKSVWGGDIRTKFSESMSDTVLGTLTKMAGSKEAKDAKLKLAAILNIDPKAASSTWAAAFARIAQDTDKTEAVAQAMKELGVASGIVASKSKEMDDALKASGDALTELVGKFKSKDDIANFGSSLVASSAKVANAMHEPEQAIQKLYEISSDINKISLFGDEDQANLLKYAAAIRETNRAYSEQKSLVDATSKKLEELKLRPKTKIANGGNAYTYDRATQSEISKEEKALADQTAKLEAERAKVLEVQSKFPDLAASQFARGAKYVEVSIAAAMQKASTEFASAVLGAVGDLPGVAEQRTKIALQQIASETNLLKAQYDLIRETKANTAIQSVISTQNEINSQKESLKASREMGDGPGISAAESKLAGLEVTLSEKKGIANIYSMGGGAKALAALREGVAAGNKEMQSQASELLNYVNSLTNLSSQIAAQADKAGAAIFKGKVDEIAAQAATEKKRLQDLNTGIDLSKQQNQLGAQLGKLSEEDLLRQNAKLDVEKENNLALIKQADITARIRSLNLSLESGKLSTETTSSTKAEISRLEASSKAASSEAATASLASNIKLQKDLLDLKLKELQEEGSLQDLRRKGDDAKKDALMEAKSLELQTAQDTDKYTQSYLDQLAYELEVYKINEDAKRQEDQLTTQHKMRDAELLAKWQSEMEVSGWAGNAESSKLEKQIRAEAYAYDLQKEAIGEVTAAKLANKSATMEAKKEQDSFNKSMEALKSLDAIFNGLSSSLADVATAFKEVSKSQAANLSTINNLQTAYDAISSSEPEKKAAAEKTLNKAKADAVKSEISGVGKIATASKKMFKEKTAAYKVFNAVETAAQTASLALELYTVGAKIAAWWAAVPAKASSEAAITGIEATAAAARAPITYAEIIGNYLAKIPAPFGMVAGVAAGAFFLSMLGLGGGGGSAPQVPTSAQRQETQGTAMSWQVKDGNLEKVQTRRGVFGDTDAKSESIANSLERIKETAVEGLSYDNRVVSLLSNINEGINGSAKALYRIEGLRTGSMFGTTEGTRGGGIFSGSLGGSVSTSIRDSGLIIKGTFAELASDTNEAVLDLFEEVTKTKKSWYGKRKTSISTATKEIDEPISQFFSGVFSNARDLFVEIGATAKITEGEINTILEGFTFDETKYSLRGLKGADLEKEVSSIVSSMLDEASLAVFSSFEQYAQFGEGMLETVIRVADNSKKVSQALENMGVKVPTLGTGIFEVTESLVKLAGGMQDFADQSSFFTENFLDEAAQLAPSQKSVVKTFKDLGLAVPKTRKEFTNLVQGLNLADLSTHSTYQALMDVAPAFDAISDAAEDAAKTGLETLKSELESSVTSLNSFIEGIGKLRDSLLLGSQSILTPLEKYGQAKSLFETTYANLSSTDTKIATAARASFSETANSFLEASRTYFASSEQYTSDFNSVLAKLDAAQAGAIAQVDTATLQLEALNSQLTILSNIDNGIAKLAGTTPLQAFAKGGYASGLAIVGEYGPEIVDFATPGRVYTADQTAGMFKAPGSGSQQQQAVVTELKALRQELAQLRKEQQAQTGDLIISNYDANQKTATEVADALTSSAAETNWLAKTKPTLV